MRLAIIPSVYLTRACIYRLFCFFYVILSYGVFVIEQMLSNLHGVDTMK